MIIQSTIVFDLTNIIKLIDFSFQNDVPYPFSYTTCLLTHL